MNVKKKANNKKYQELIFSSSYVFILPYLPVHLVSHGKCWRPLFDSGPSFLKKWESIKIDEKTIGKRKKWLFLPKNN